MSKFTTEVRSICETYAGYTEPQGLGKVNEIVHETHNQIMGNYPIFDEAYRETLNTKIIKHYYTREICAETVGLWKLWLNNRMNEIMPYYNKLYASELLKFNPFYDVDLSTEHVRSEDTTGKNESRTTDERSENGESKRSDSSARSSDTINENQSTTNSVSKNETHSGTNGDSESQTNKSHTDRYSDTPQGGLNGMEAIEQDLYLTNARLIGESENDRQKTNQQTDALGVSNYSDNGTGKDTSSVVASEHLDSEGKQSTEISSVGTRNDENNISSTEDYLEHVRGKRGGSSYASLLKEYRETFINIDKMVIDELGDLFFGLWE